jgi:hypothetical protein
MTFLVCQVYDYPRLALCVKYIVTKEKYEKRIL